MEMNLFNLAGAIFLLICVAIFFMLFRALRFVANSAQNFSHQYTLLGLGVWIVLVSALAVSGFFQNFQSLPPRALLVFMPPLLFLFFCLRSDRFKTLLQKVPDHWLLYAQSFRVLMEICLWLLFVAEEIPVQMSFEGRNFDVLVGLTALPIGYWVQKKAGPHKKLILAWNFFGLLLLSNIVIIALLSTPSPLRVFMNEPSNTIVAQFPYVLLPAFVVPFAYFLHAFSIKKALQE